jgi:putative Ca2+/H+ antiporter (TMEM165/GDT1 family)
VEAFWISAGIVFVAELGDKSQLMVMTFAARYRALTVLLAVSVASAITFLVSVIVGAAAGAALPTRAISAAAGVAFLVFALWTLRELRAGDGSEAVPTAGSRSVLLTVGAAFLLAELGDKTMLATITLAAENGALGTWLGATAGLVAADAVAIVVGHQLHLRLPERVIRIGAAVTFAVFGLLLLVDALRG